MRERRLWGDRIDYWTFSCRLCVRIFGDIFLPRRSAPNTLDPLFLALHPTRTLLTDTTMATFVGDQGNLSSKEGTNVNICE
jgi:hypothetical protein